ncbi:MAG: hypothetical protein WD872_07260 [Pirellulaceae bacterium]
MAVFESCLVELSDFDENPRASVARATRPRFRVVVQNALQDALQRSIELKLTLSQDAASPQKSPPAESAARAPAFSVDDLLFVCFADNRTVVPDDDRARTADELDTIYGLDSRGLHRQAMERVARYVDELLNSGKFPECDAMLTAAKADELSAPVLVAFLGITLAARGKLGFRASFYDRAFARVSHESGENEASELLARYK